MTLPRRIYPASEVQGLQSDTAREFRRLDGLASRPFGRPRSVFKDDDARFDETIVAYTIVGNVTLTLPPIGSNDTGRVIAVIRGDSGSNTIKVRAKDPGVTIGSASSLTISSIYDRVLFIAVTPNLWVAKAAVSAAPEGIVPFFEWDGATTSQFLSLRSGSGVTNTNGSPTVVSWRGLNWLRMQITGGLGGHYAAMSSVLPFDVTPPSADYEVRAEFVIQGFAGGGGNKAAAGVVCRSEATTNYGTGYANASLNDVGDSQVIKMEGGTTATTYTNVNGAHTLVTTEGKNLSLGCVGETIMQYSSDAGVRLLDDASGSYINPGNPGLIAGSNDGAGTTTVDIYFRNIRCFQLPYGLE